MTCFRRVGSKLVIRVCLQMNENLRAVKRKFYQKIVEELFWKGVQQFTSEDVQWTILESYPIIHLKGLSTK